MLSTIILFFSLLAANYSVANSLSKDILEILEQSENNKKNYLEEAKNIKQHSENQKTPNSAQKHYDHESLRLLKEAESQKKLHLNEALTLKEQAASNTHYLKEAEGIHNKTQEQLQKTLIDLNHSNCAQDKSKTLKPGVPPKLLVFVSLSMPKQSLKLLFSQAAKFNAILVMRGLKEGSFIKTAEYLKDLEIGLRIDPALFKKYKIQKVPTFVWLDKEEPILLTGNVSLYYANQVLQDKLK